MLGAIAAAVATAACDVSRPRAASSGAGGGGSQPSASAARDEPASTARGSTMPAVFVGHGAPLIALDPRKGEPWREWGRALPRPAAVLSVSAHWWRPGLATGTETTRELIYDFSGFPEPLYRVRYEAPGAPEVAERSRSLLADVGGGARSEPERGLDHGVWTPLVHMFPEADVPVVQLSLPSDMSFRELYELGRQLAPLRQEGVLVMGSGNITHNLRRMKPDGTAPEDFAKGFDTWIAARLEAGDVDAIVDAREAAPAFRDNHPTVDHYAPLLVALGAGELGAGGRARFTVEGFEYGNLSRRCVEIG